MTSLSAPRAINLLREFSVPLIAGVVAALVWANLSGASYHAFVGREIIARINVEFLVNELFMAIFFGIAAVEITDSLAPGGSLNPPRKAVMPLMATAGGMVGPAVCYLLLNALVGQPALRHGWGIGTATDIALAWLVARFVFGKMHPAISFLLLLAIADDFIGLIIIALFYPDPNHQLFLPPLALVAAGMAIAFALRRLRVKSYWPYLALGGTLSWAGLFLAHLHGALALTFIVPFMPHRRQAGQETVFDLPALGTSTLTTFEHEWKVVVDFGLFFFGLVNAGVELSALGTVTWLVLASLVVGKSVGICAFAWILRLLGFHLPTGMTAWDLLLVSMIAGMGLTVALFVASAAFTDREIEAAAKMGVLGSTFIAPLVILLNTFWKKASGTPAARL
jgi:Na+:H+ antiporter, NhaA family